MNRPEILIADEPTSDLDVQTELKIVGVLRTIHQTGVTVLMVTHSLELIPYATRALRMEEGQLISLEEGVGVQALPVIVSGEPAAAAGRSKPAGAGWLSWFRKPANAALAGLGVAVVLLVLIAALLIVQLGDEPAAATTAATGGPGPVLGGGGMSGANGTYDPSEYNLYGNTGLYASVTGGAWPYKIDPPPGDRFEDPAELEDANGAEGVFEGKLEAKMAQVTFGNTNASVMTYNGEYPGPLVRVKSGDKLKLELTNSLPETSEKNVLGYEKNRTDLELYGLHVPPAADTTGDEGPVAPGAARAYEYDLAKQPGGALGFVHPGVHGSAAEQQWAGLFAPVLVEDGNPALSGYETHTMVIKDVAISGSAPQAHLFMSDFMYGKEGSIVTVNGQVNPVLSAKRGQVQRWRIFNASNARFYRLYLENHVL
jgi:FtsP/CotA-like multicopper oxidase with cupredoxin domain